MGSAHPNLVPYRAFEANDGWFVIAVGSDNQWGNLCTLLNIENQDEWLTNAGRIAERDVIEAMLTKIIAEHSRAELEELLTGIPCAPVNTITEALNDKQSNARGLITKYNGVDELASPLRFY